MYVAVLCRQKIFSCSLMKKVSEYVNYMPQFLCRQKIFSCSLMKKVSEYVNYMPQFLRYAGVRYRFFFPFHMKPCV